MKHNIPSSTYRLQMSKSFTFKDAANLIPYLKALGIEMVYLSPIFQTEKDSPNPYKISSPDQINEQLGGEVGFDLFTSSLKQHGIKHMIDLVPNHMGATVENSWWYDLLKTGQSSEYAQFFDVDWNLGKGKVILPILGDETEMQIEGTHLKIDGRLFPLRDGSHLYPIEKALEYQHYRLVHWKDTHSLINYRRFFDIADLVCVKIGKKKWYERYHKTVFQWIREGKVHGLRVDHPDGIWDVEKYLKRLRGDCKKENIVTEKILQSDEYLRDAWAVDGTVGYDALNTLNAFFVDTRSEKAFNRLYEEFADVHENPHEMIAFEKKKYTAKYLASEMGVISENLAKVANRRGLDLSQSEVKKGLLDFLSHIPIYRTYVEEKKKSFHKEDVQAIKTAVQKAHLDQNMKMFFSTEILKKPYRKILLRIQQLMPAVFAKGFEDTFLYLYNRMISLNEVGSTPWKFGIAISEFHNINLKRQKSSPYSMVTTSTHDTKRSSDVRMRIAVLSEIPDEFEEKLRRWRDINKSFCDSNTEYFFYQTLVGFWVDDSPKQADFDLLSDRIKVYMIKVVREAKRYTDWVDGDIKYETDLLQFIDRVLSSEKFWKEFYPFQKKVTYAGRLNSLCAQVLKIGMPGVADFYQGEELWRYDLVDPDNRRFVNFNKRMEMLKMIDTSNHYKTNWPENLSDGNLKLYVMKTGLLLRQKHKELFVCGTYEPIVTNKTDLVAFRRCWKKEEVIIKCHRFFYGQGRKEIKIEKGFHDIYCPNHTISHFPFSIQIRNEVSV